MQITKLATININSITATTRVGMLQDFIRTNDLDLIFLQEVSTLDFLSIPGYTTQ
jgi:exonuclease III